MAVVSGDPGKAGPFVVRLKMPAGYKIAPHWLAIHLLHLRSVEILPLSHGLIGGEQPLDLVAQGGMGGWVSLDPSLHLFLSNACFAVEHCIGGQPCRETASFAFKRILA